MDMQEILKEFDRRISNLEEEVRDLKNKLYKNKKHSLVSPKKLGLIPNKLTRTVSRMVAIGRLEESNKGFVGTKANREEGSGIVLRHPYYKKIHLIKFYHSICKNDDKFSGNFKISKKTLDKENLDFFIFNTQWRGTLYSFIFSYRQLDELLYEKKLDGNNDFHLNFEIRGNDFFDIRSKKFNKGNVNITRFYNKWELDKYND